jgi:hypothetical protein
MQLRVQVQQAWQKLSSRERKLIRSCNGIAPRGLRVRCKIVLVLVGKFTDLIRSGMATSFCVT